MVTAKIRNAAKTNAWQTDIVLDEFKQSARDILSLAASVLNNFDECDDITRLIVFDALSLGLILGFFGGIYAVAEANDIERTIYELRRDSDAKADVAEASNPEK